MNGVRTLSNEQCTNALTAWAPVLFVDFRTPRAAKQFLNRVRYLAMLQRDPVAEVSRWERFIVYLAQWRPVRWTLTKLGMLKKTQPAEHRTTKVDITEEALVGLSVIREVCPAWLTDDEFWKQPVRTYASKALKSEALGAALRKVERNDVFSEYRDRWADVSKAVVTN